MPRRGLSIVELLLVVSMLACVILGSQFWPGLQSNMPGGVLTPERSAGEDLPPVFEVAIAPNQREAISVGMDGQLRVHDLASRNCLSAIPNKYCESRSACYSPDGSRLLVSSRNGHVELWSLISDPPTSRTISAHDGDIHCCYFAPDGTRFVTCGIDQQDIVRCTVWDSETLSPLLELRDVPAVVRKACFLRCGTRLLTGDVHGHLYLWDLKTGRITQQIDVAGPADLVNNFVEGMVLLPTETEVLVALRNGNLGVWDVKTGVLRRKFPRDGRKLASLCLSSDGSRAVCGGFDGQIEVWDVVTGIRLQSFTGHDGPVPALAMNKNRTLVVSGGWDGQLKFWKI